MMFSNLFSRATAATALRGSKISPSRLLSSLRPILPNDDAASASQSENTAVAAQAVFPDGVASKHQSDTADHISQSIRAHQESARFPTVDVVRTQLQHIQWGMFWTEGEYGPSGSKVDFACDPNGCPVLAINNVPDSDHTKNLLADPQCVLAVSIHPKGEDRPWLRINIEGDAIYISENDRVTIHNEYLVKQPNPFWISENDSVTIHNEYLVKQPNPFDMCKVDFGDSNIQYVRVEPTVVGYQYVVWAPIQFSKSGEFSKDEYKAAKVDPISQFSKPIAAHMNKHHAEELKLIVQHSTSILVDFADMLDHSVDLDSLGFSVKAGYRGHTFELRIPFPRPAKNRNDVKTLMEEMLQAAKAHSS